MEAQASLRQTARTDPEETDRIVFVADSDSQIYGALPFLEAFDEAGWRPLLLIPEMAKLPAQLQDEIRARFRILESPVEEWIRSGAAARAEALFVLLTGSGIAGIRRSLIEAAQDWPRRPLLLTAFNGVVYEKFEEGLSWRLGYDFICLNGRRDLALAEEFVGRSPYAASRFVLTGLKRAAPPPRRDEAEPRRKTLLFAEQVIVPARKAERLWLFQRLNALAWRNPDWEVAIKPRVSRQEKTFHKSLLHPEDALPEDRRAANLTFSYEPMGAALARTDLLLSVSSTAIFDAIAAGVPTRWVADFGIRTELGTNFFAASGLELHLEDLEDLDALKPQEPSAHWLERAGASGGEGPADLLRILAEAQERPGLAPFAPSPYDGRAFPTPEKFARLIQEEQAAPAGASLRRETDPLSRAAAEALAEGRFAEAAALYRRFLERRPESSKNWRGLAEAQAALGRKEEALASLRRADSIAPGNRNILEKIERLGGKRGFRRMMLEGWSRWRRRLGLRRGNG